MAAESHRRDMEWFPPPAPMYLDVCGAATYVVKERIEKQSRVEQEMKERMR